MKSLMTCLTAVTLTATAYAADTCHLSLTTQRVTMAQAPACQSPSNVVIHSAPAHTLVVQNAQVGTATKAATKDIVDTAVSAGSFNTLVAAVKAAGLVDTLKGDGPFTVFAPTDAAFAKLPQGTVAELLKPENKKKLQSILTYHVVSGKVKAAQVIKLTGAKTVQGEKVDIAVKNGAVSVDGAKVVKTDVETTNGVIHVIDNVLLP